MARAWPAAAPLGAAGWLGGPAGAVIGVGAGLALGVAVDWWLTEDFKANLTEELTRYFNNLERGMIDGVAAEGNRPAADRPANDASQRGRYGSCDSEPGGAQALEEAK